MIYFGIYYKNEPTDLYLFDVRQTMITKIHGEIKTKRGGRSYKGRGEKKLRKGKRKRKRE